MRSTKKNPAAKNANVQAGNRQDMDRAGHQIVLVAIRIELLAQFRAARPKPALARSGAMYCLSSAEPLRERRPATAAATRRCRAPAVRRSGETPQTTGSRCAASRS